MQVQGSRGSVRTLVKVERAAFVVVQAREERVDLARVRLVVDHARQLLERRRQLRHAHLLGERRRRGGHRCVPLALDL